MKKEIIYHLVPRKALKDLITENEYCPENFQKDGFIHCTEKIETTLLVANDYFISEEEVLILKLNISKIQPPVKFESASPITGGGSSHLQSQELFPHIYGKLNLDSIEGVGILKKSNNIFNFPEKFKTWEEFIK